VAASLTLVVADNGYALGTHRRQPGKTLGYEEDIHVPLIVRGPGVKKGVVDSLSSYGMVDLSRTILDVAEAATDYHSDGVKINLHQDSHADAVGVASHQLARHSISEYWVLGVEEGIYGGTLRANNSGSYLSPLIIRFEFRADVHQPTAPSGCMTLTRARPPRTRILCGALASVNFTT
jgi:arylsulfatase A-like enzyme